eukprot:ANDGO_02806.mRNA.1 L-serine dehydratase
MAESKDMHLHTPLVESSTLSESTGCRVFLKLDALQPTGSFKIRGLGRLCAEAKASGADMLVSSSGGNAGIAAAYAGKQLHMKTIVVVPKTTLPISIDKLRRLGAIVTVHGENWNEADELARKLVAENGATAAYCPPFDHPLIWTGNSSIVDELVQDWRTAQSDFDKPGAILLCVGGGGLYCGVVDGLERHRWGDVPIFVAETEGAASFYECWKCKEHVTIPSINTIATTLGARRIAPKAYYDMMRRPQDQAFIVSDANAVDACRQFLDSHRLLVEPSCGSTLALMYHRAEELKLSQFPNVVVIVCGGSGINLHMLNNWIETVCK